MNGFTFTGDKCQENGQSKTPLLLDLIDDPTTKTIGQ